MSGPSLGSVSAVHPPLPPGFTVPGLALGAEVGRGANSVVLRAERDGTGYAVKVLLEAGDDEALDFRREAALLASLNHPGVVTIHEVGRSAGYPYLVMDLVDGRSLADLVRDGPASEALVLRVAIELVDALAAAHAAGIVHRDVKPDNVMLRSSGQVQLIDFGLAGRADEDAGDIAAGTFVYTAPEQTGALRRPVDGRADLYALGVLLFECLTGRPPFAGDDVGVLIRSHLSVTPPPLGTVRPDLSGAIGAVVAKLLAKDPDDRYRSARGLRADLVRIVGGERDPFPLDADPSLTTFEDPPMIGRNDELSRLLGRWRATRRGLGGVAVVEGPAGCGKTRLLREMAGLVRAEGCPVLSGTWSADGGDPLEVLRSALAGYVAPEGYGATGARRLREAAGDTAPLLASLLPAAVLPGARPEGASSPEVDESQFDEAAARLLVRLAEAGGGAVLELEHAQHGDRATRRVLARLAPMLAEAPLLVVLTARSDGTAGDGDGAPAELLAEMGDAADVRLELGPLDDDAVESIVASRLGGRALPAAFVRRVAAGAGGNPLAVVEYARAVVDNGLVRPSWGTWTFDEAGLDALALPDDVIDLLLQRVGRLGPQARRLLTVGAAVGSRFPAELVAAAAAIDLVEAVPALDDAVSHRLVDVVPGGGFAFVHDRVRDALLGRVAAAELREIHQAIGEHLAARCSEDGIYAVARHLLAGDTRRDPVSTVSAAAAAGVRALDSHAPAEALDVLSRAVEVAQDTGIAVPGRVHADLGLAAGRVGMYDVALRHLTLALDGEDDVYRRAVLFGRLADVRIQRWEADQVMELARRGLAELGYRLPRSPALLLLTTLPLFVWGLVLGKLPARWRLATGERAERIRLRASLTITLTEGAFYTMSTALIASLPPRSLPLVQRLGFGLEYARTRGVLAMSAVMLGRPGHAARRFRKLHAESVAHGNTFVAKWIDYMEAISAEVMQGANARTGERLRPLLVEQSPWLRQHDYLTGVAALQLLCVMRGHVLEAARLRQYSQARVRDDTLLLGNALTAVAAEIAALSGQPAEAAELIGQQREFLAKIPTSPVTRGTLAIAALRVTLEQAEHGAPLDDAVDEFERVGLSIRAAFGIYRVAWMYVAFARLAQAESATGAKDRAARLKQAEKAVKDLKRAVNGTILRAYQEVARADLRRLRGDAAGALRDLGRASGLSADLDAPLVDYEIARCRARACRALGAEGDAVRHARAARLLAVDHGWRSRARWLVDEFGLEGGGDEAGVTTTARRRAHLVGDSLLSMDDHRDRLGALQQVSLASARILDPEQLTRVALDEMVRIFNAERGFVFLRETPEAGLTPFLARDDEGRDLDDLGGYGSTLVERVDETHKPIVVTGSEEGAALGSKSTLVHGLRSIMVAPLSVKGRRLGVVYFDSRAAKGIFTSADLELLEAMIGQVAAALETARTAQLELAVRAAEGERDLAEVLHRAITDLASSLDPRVVRTRFLDTVREVLQVSVVAVVSRHADGTLTAVRTGSGDAVRVDRATDPTLAQLLAAEVTTRGSSDRQPAPLPDLLGEGIRAWTAVPLTLRGESRGLLVAASAGRPATDAEAEIATAIASAGVTAMDNAELFRQVQKLATRDSLSGLYNRRHFFDIGRNALAAERPPGTVAAAVMVDIDHFKAVNDTHGHPVGDEVIRAVADRLVAALPGSAVLCRYGGEEFAVLMTGLAAPDVPAAARRLHEAVTADAVATASGALPVTVSVGFAVHTAESEDLGSLLVRADAALYAAKRAGRNTVVPAEC